MDQETNTQKELVKVFLRTFDKKAKSVKFPKEMKADELKETVS